MSAPESVADVIVAGAGAGGLAAAIAARLSGATPVVIDASSSFRRSCTTAMSTGLVPGAGTPQQSQAGVDDDPSLFAVDIERKSRGTSDRPTVELLTRLSAEVVQWLGDLAGAPLLLAQDAVFPGHSRARLHALPDRSGQALHALLCASAERLGILIETPLSLRSVRDSEDGLTVGLERPDGTTETISAGAVVIATGGFAQHAGLRSKHLTDFAATRYFGGDGNTGTAISIAEDLGLSVGALASHSAHGSYASRHGVLVTWTAVMSGGIIIDTEGRRFADETMGYSGFASHFARRPDCRGHLLLDRVILEACSGFPDIETVEVDGGIRWCQDVAELAAATGSDPSVLSGTLHEVQVAASQGEPDRVGRRSWKHVPSWPIGVIPIEPIIAMSQGGILVNAHGFARRPQGGAHQRVIAVGGSATGLSGVSGDGYLAGNGLLLALGLGLVGGRAAAEVGRPPSAHGDPKEPRPGSVQKNT
jgi:fumarate reductase flavoprotein subunit